MNISISNPRDELVAIIHQEEQRIRKTFPLERRLSVMELARAMDFYSSRRFLAQEEPSDDLVQITQLISYGLNKAIALFMDGEYIYPTYPIISSNEHSQQWADSVLINCGRLGVCEHLLEICKFNLGELRKEQPHEYRFRFTAESMGAESYEAGHSEWFIQYISRKQEALLTLLRTREREVIREMAKRVKKWNKQYIEYDSHPLIDEYYEEKGLLYAQLMFGHDSFPPEAKFGGIEFRMYRTAVGLLVGWAFKHLAFCAQLLQKYPELHLRNIITIPQEIHVFRTYLSAAMDIDLESAQLIMGTLTLNEENKSVHCLVSRDYVAPAFVNAGQGWVIRPIWGSLSHPFQFMLDELKRCYRSDWDSSVDFREKVFRQQLFDLFPHNRFVKINRNINIKVGGTFLTDIDAGIFDRKTGVVALFQLKWQDYFRSSMRGRESQKKNLLQTGNKWIQRVSDWIQNTDIKIVGQTIGLDRVDIAGIKDFRLFIIGRNSAHFSGPSNPDMRAAWGIWYQVIRYLEESIDYSDPLNSLFTKLIEDSPLKKDLPEVSGEEFKIGDNRIILEPIKG
jgi:hypothetical protein